MASAVDQDRKDNPIKQFEDVEQASFDGLKEERRDMDSFDPKMASKLRHAIDWRLIPALGAMYGISLMDRKNVSNAAIAGMLKDLNMTKGAAYNLVTLCFFITYVLLQPLMVIACRKMGPRLFLPMICTIWGGVVIGTGFVKNWQSMIPLRLILGALESGYFPGCVYLLSCWYTKCRYPHQPLLCVADCP
jgi:sugar phosphate permease